jgi:hypothetical protein
VAEEADREQGSDGGGPLGGGEVGREERRDTNEGKVVGHVGHLGGVAHGDLRRGDRRLSGGSLRMLSVVSAAVYRR